MPPLSFRRDKTPGPDSSTSTSAVASGSASTAQGNVTAESTASPGRSFRFLRRKPSMSARQHSDTESTTIAGSSNVPMPNTASSTSSFGDPLNNLPPELAAGYRPARRGSEPGNGIMAPVVSAGVVPAPGTGASGKKPWTETDGVVVIDSGAADQSLPRPSRTAAEHPFMSHMSSSGSMGKRPITPPTAIDLTPAPIYPTALSPPRRPMPKSRGTGTGMDVVSPMVLDSPIPGLGMGMGLGMGGAGGGGGAGLGMGSTMGGVGPSPRPTVSAEWLSRKPSGRRGFGESSRAYTDRNETQHVREGSGGMMAERSGSGSPQPKLRAAAPITPTSLPTRSRAPSSSTTHSASASTSAAESDDGEVGVIASKRSSHRDGTGAMGQYEVEVVCTDTRDENDEMRWEVVVRKRRPVGATSTTADSALAGSSGVPSAPLPLSTSTALAPAPSSASSINLSLSLDNPTGKLVFIAFPMDIHATPRRKPRPVASSTASAGSSTAPTTPPRAITPPPAPNPNMSTPPSLGHRKGVSESSMYPSPSRAGRRSPSQPSPRGGAEIWTPRRTRMVSASDLNGGLYARGTVDGMSEELERVASVGAALEERPRSRLDEEERAARVARWNHDKI